MWPFTTKKKLDTSIFEEKEQGKIHDYFPDIPLGAIRAVPCRDYKWRIQQKIEHGKFRTVTPRDPSGIFGIPYTVYDGYFSFELSEYHNHNKDGFDTAENALENYKKYQEWMAQPLVMMKE